MAILTKRIRWNGSSCPRCKWALVDGDDYADDDQGRGARFMKVVAVVLLDEVGGTVKPEVAAAVLAVV